MKLGIEELSIIVEGLRLRVKQLSSSVTEINQSIENLETEDGQKAPAIMQTTSPAAIASFSDGAEDMPIKSLKCTIVPVQAGTGDPAPDNVRPITGWDGVSVNRCGKNLLNTTLETTTRNGITVTRNSDGTFRATGTATATADFYLNYHVGLEAGVSYTLSGCPSGGSSTKYKLDLYMASGTQTDYGNGVTFTGTKTEAIARIIVYPNAGAVDLLFKPMLRIASVSDETYEPYSADSHTLSFPSTVYGGWVDVIKGELHVTSAVHTFDGTESLSTYGSGSMKASRWIDSSVATTGYQYTPLLISNLLKTGRSYNDIFDSPNVTLNGGIIIQPEIKDTSDETGTQVGARVKAILAEWYASGTPLVCVYPLATEQVIPLDPVTITTLLGVNNISCNTGTVEVEYAADTKTYIDNAIAAVTPEPEPTPEPEQDEAPPEEEEEEEAEPAPEEDIAEPEEVEKEEAAEVEEIAPVVKRATRKK